MITYNSNSEKKSIEGCLQQRRDDVKLYAKVVALIDGVSSKKKKPEERIIVLGNFRFYLFKSGGKLVHEVHNVDLKEISSPAPNELILSCSNATTPLYKIKSVLLDQPQCEQLFRRLYQSYVTSFPGVPSLDAPKLSANPPERLEQILYSLGPSLGTIGPCGGFSTTYKAQCDYMGVPALLSLCWDVDQVLPKNRITEFNLSEYHGVQEKDIKPIIKTLESNSHFTTIRFEHCRLPPDAITQLGELLTRNPYISTVSLIHNGADNLQPFFTHLTKRFGALTHLDLSGNHIDGKAATALAGALQTGPPLSVLNLAGCGAKPASMEAILWGIHHNPTMSGALHTLNIGGNKLESPGTVALSTLLLKSTALSELHAPNTAMLYSVLRSGCSALHTVDLAGNKAVGTKEKEGSVLTFLSHCPSLTSINLARAQITPDDLKELLAQKDSILKSVSSLDLSDNDLGDEGIQALCEVAYFNSNLKTLAIGGNFRTSKGAKARGRVLEMLISLVEDANSLESLSLAVSGTKQGQLKSDLVPLILSLMANRNLTSLNIEGNGMTDLGALALAKMVQRNSTLRCLKWDDNGTSLRGIQHFRDGLMNGCGTLCTMPLPFQDIGLILKGDSQSHAKIRKIVEDIQQQLFANLARTPPPLRSDISLGSISGQVGNVDTPTKAPAQAEGSHPGGGGHRRTPSSGGYASSMLANSKSPSAPSVGRTMGKSVSTTNLLPGDSGPSPSRPGPAGAGGRWHQRQPSTPNPVTSASGGNLGAPKLLSPTGVKTPPHPSFGRTPPATPQTPTSAPPPSSSSTPAAAPSPIPSLVSQCISYLMAKGLTSHGLFRICASATQLRALKARFEKGQPVNLAAEVSDCDTIAGLLKTHFREAAEPLIGEKYHAPFEAASKAEEDREKITKLKEGLGALPAVSQTIASSLFELLFKVSENAEVNAMSPENLAICWAPTLFRSFEGHFIPLTAYMIDKYEFIFQNKSLDPPRPPSPDPVASSTPEPADTTMPPSPDEPDNPSSEESASEAATESAPEAKATITAAAEEPDADSQITASAPTDSDSPAQDVVGKSRGMSISPQIRPRQLSSANRHISRKFTRAQFAPSNRMSVGGLSPPVQRSDRFSDMRYATMMLSDLNDTPS
eukprot:TRINITY_DN3553_c0_g1_i11.p1 TRINITY_DN3553_c0_g1~~TRINITY_DN3553_c0_g1_i11.p1  ORF type:complete len:1136 (+),score=267.47 TRINITY_DN3553_c0_g1_i11:86-3493(+)